MEALEGIEAARWELSTNWIIADGSLHGSISFDTSADDGLQSIPGGVLLQKTDSNDSEPCEITITFREKHDIHSVYILSTARIYEIYFGSDQQNNSKEYLCTVRCGATAIEETSPSITEVDTTESQNGSVETVEQTIQGCSNSSDEDGWVEVKVPVSPMQDESSSTNQIHYEATAEISGACPCASVTLRLLSLEAKACVHVEEIYIYADPAEPNDPDSHGSMGESSGGTSLLAMLVPNLLQLSKSRASGIQNRSISDDSVVQNSQSSAYKAAKERETTPLRSVPKEGASHQVPESVDAENNLANSRVEKVLDELVSRVGKIEAFCSRFEENMMKPLGCIETRLQRLEQQLDAFVVRAPTSERVPCSRISAPQFSCDESDSENPSSRAPSSRADDVAASVPESHTCTGLVVKAPEFLSEEDELTYSGNTSGSMAMDCPNDNNYGAFASVPESDMCQGLSVNAPEFLNEDDDTLDSVVKDLPGDKKPLSIDGALASALAAFLASTSIKSDNISPSLIDVPHEFSNGTSSDLASPLGDDVTTSENLFDESDVENTESDVANKDLFGESENVFDESENVFDESDVAVKKGTSFDDSSLLDDELASPVFASQTHSGLIVIAPEFPNKDGDFIGCDDTTDSHGGDFPEDQAASPTDGGSASALAVFLSSMMVKSSDCRPTLQNRSSELSTVLERSTYNSSLLEESLQQEDHVVNWDEWKQNHNGHDGGCDDDDNSEEVVRGDPRLNPRGSGWAVNSSTYSSYDENSISNRVLIEWSDGGSTDSNWGPFTVDQNCNSELPLEVLLGAMSIANGSGEVEDGIASGEQHNPYQSAVDLLLLDLEGLAPPTDPSRLGADVMIGTEEPGGGGSSSSSQKRFSSLI